MWLAALVGGAIPASQTQSAHLVAPEGLEVIKPIVSMETGETGQVPATLSSGQAIRLHDGWLLLAYPEGNRIETTYSATAGWSWSRS
jgi:hypothetical protein